MRGNRRDFMERVATGAAFMAGVAALPRSAAALPRPASAEWDLSWTDRITGQHKAVFDATEIEDGAGFLRAMIWQSQYAQVLGARPADLSAVLVIRHAAIPLAMKQEYWDRYQVGKKKKVKNPFSDKPTVLNPAQLPKSELPPPFAPLNLEGFKESGGIALACNLAFTQCVSTIAKAEKVSQEEARTRALALLHPSVILQPSGVFATIRAQEAGCQYIKSS